MLETIHSSAVGVIVATWQTLFFNHVLGFYSRIGQKYLDSRPKWNARVRFSENETILKQSALYPIQVFFYFF